MKAPSYSVLITGAASGIGLGLVEHLASQGHRVIATDVDAQLPSKMRRVSGNIRTVQLDVASNACIDSAVNTVAGDPPDILINNAGLQYVSPLEEYPPDKWAHLVAVMLTGAAMLTRAVVPGMKARNFGRIVNIGSIHALVASPFKSAYVSAKHGLVGFSKVIALETGEHDITINTVCPSFVHTPLADNQIDSLAKTHGLSRDEVVKQIMLKPMPKRCFISIEEITGTVDFLLSPHARNITGQCITLDGGWTVQ